MGLSSSNIKKLLNFQKKKISSHISGNRNPEKTSYTFSKESFSYISGNVNPEKRLCISGNRTFLYFRK